MPRSYTAPLSQFSLSISHRRVKRPNASAYSSSGLTICDYRQQSRTSLRLDNVIRLEIPVDVGVDRGIRSSATRDIIRVVAKERQGVGERVCMVITYTYMYIHLHRYSRRHHYVQACYETARKFMHRALDMVRNSAIVFTWSLPSRTANNESIDLAFAAVPSPHPVDISFAGGNRTTRRPTAAFRSNLIRIIADTEIPSADGI